MKVKVKKEFIDKHTFKLHPVDEVFECTEDRLKEIQSASMDYVEKVESRRRKVAE